MVSGIPAETRYGQFRISTRYLQFEPLTIAEALSMLEFVPTHCEHRLDTGCLHYIGWSPRFEIVPDGERTPEYDIAIRNDRIDDQLVVSEVEVKPHNPSLLHVHSFTTDGERLRFSLDHYSPERSEPTDAEPQSP